MTETPATSEPFASSRPLFRDRDRGMFAGVCAGLARYTDTDPVIWRIVTAVLTVFGGTGAVLYLLGWLLIPVAGSDVSLAQSWLARRGHRTGWLAPGGWRELSPKAVAVIALVAVVLLGGLNDGRGFAAVVILAVVAYLVYRERDGRPERPTVPPETTGWGPVPFFPNDVPTAPVREHSRLGVITVSLAVTIAGILAWANQAGARALTPARIIAVALLTVGAGLVVGTWYGRARWLVVVGVLLSLGLATAAAADATSGRLAGGFGSRTWNVSDARPQQDYRLGAGDARLDLRALSPEGRHVAVRAHVGLGHLLILLPPDLPVRVHATVRTGELVQDGRKIADGATGNDRILRYGSADPRVEVEAGVGTGQVEVRRG